MLAFVVINLRNLLFDKYGLDIAQYFSLPMVAFDSMLKSTKSRLELISDPTMHLMIESGIRGIQYLIYFTSFMNINMILTGGYCCSQTLRYAEANNKYLPNYDPTQDSSYIMYVDANNLVSNK